MPNKSQYKHKLEYNNTYNRNNYRSFAMRFNINSEDHSQEKENNKEERVGLIVYPLLYITCMHVLLYLYIFMLYFPGNTKSLNPYK